ncbi:MAG: hypothetical protein M1833_006973 [Piccolia ochrophora]|nr:MAG: hypothetical protein M1833_006973 [Piccolia ochrophora]
MSPGPRDLFSRVPPLNIPIVPSDLISNTSSMDYRFTRSVTRRSKEPTPARYADDVEASPSAASQTRHAARSKTILGPSIPALPEVPKDAQYSYGPIVDQPVKDNYAVGSSLGRVLQTDLPTTNRDDERHADADGDESMASGYNLRKRAGATPKPSRASTRAKTPRKAKSRQSRATSVADDADISKSFRREEDIYDMNDEPEEDPPAGNGNDDERPASIASNRYGGGFNSSPGGALAWMLALLGALFAVVVVITLAQAGWDRNTSPSLNSSQIPDLEDWINAQGKIASVDRRLQRQESLIDDLNRILPDQIAVEKNEDGELHISPAFLTGLEEKLRSDVQASIKSRHGSMTDEEIESSARRQWELFLKKHDDVIQQYIKEHVISSTGADKSNAKDPKARNLFVLTKKDFVELVDSKVEDLRRILDNRHQNLNTIVEKKASSIAREVAVEVSKKFGKFKPSDVITPAHLRALADATLLENLRYEAENVNFFSPGLGAVIVPYDTSESYRRPTTFGQRLAKLFFPVRIPEPRPASEALNRWHDVGDCWCAPLEAQLVVLLPRSIYMQEVVVEHISHKATLEIGAAPRYMEAYAQIEDRDLRSVVRDEAEKWLGPEIRSAGTTLDNSWVRVAMFEYHIRHPNHVQRFPLSFDMHALGATVQKVAIRVHRNWAEYRVDDTSDLPYTCLYRVRLHGTVLKRDSIENYGDGAAGFGDDPVYPAEPISVN